MLLIKELVNSCATSPACYQCVSIRESHCGRVVQEFVVRLVYCFYLPLLTVHIKYHYFVCISEKTNLFVGHFDCSVVNLRELLDGLVHLICAKFNLRVGHLNWAQLFSLTVQFFFLALEIVKPVADVAPFYLLSSEVFYFTCCFLDIILAKLNQTEVLLKVFLLTQHPGLLNFESVGVLELYFSLFYQNLLDYSFKILVDMLHDFDLSSLHFFPKIKSLINQNFRPLGQIFQILHNFISVFLKYIH